MTTEKDDAAKRLLKLQEEINNKINILSVMRESGVGKNSRHHIEAQIETYKNVLKLLNQ